MAMGEPSRSKLNYDRQFQPHLLEHDLGSGSFFVHHLVAIDPFALLE